MHLNHNIVQACRSREPQLTIQSNFILSNYSCLCWGWCWCQYSYHKKLVYWRSQTMAGNLAKCCWCVCWRWCWLQLLFLCIIGYYLDSVAPQRIWIYLLITIKAVTIHRMDSNILQVYFLLALGLFSHSNFVFSLPLLPCVFLMVVVCL